MVGQLCGKKFKNAGFDQHVIAQVVQNIRFRVNENGALLKSEARALAPTSEAVTIPPARLICNGPFLVLLARAESKVPYLALWVGNDELLLKSPAPEAPHN